MDREFLTRLISEIIDHPSVYMGGPSRQAQQKANRIIDALQKAGYLSVDPVNYDIISAESAKWRTIQNLAQTGTMDNIMKMDSESIRNWVALAFEESARRKELELFLESINEEITRELKR